MLLAWASAGCAGLHLHNEKNAETARTATTNLTQIVTSVDAAFAQETQNQNALLEAELTATRRFIEQDEEARLAIITISESTLYEDWFKLFYLKRLDEIGLDCSTSATTCLRALRAIKNASNNMDAEWGKYEERLSFLREAGYLGPVSCTYDDGISPLEDKFIQRAAESSTDPDFTKSDIGEIYSGRLNSDGSPGDDGIVFACNAWQSQVGDIRGLIAKGGGEADRALELREASRNQLKEADRRRSEIKKAFADASKALKDAKGEDPEKAPSEIISDQIKTLQEAASGLGDLYGAVSDATKAEERLKAISCVLNAATSADDAGADAAASASDEDECLTAKGKKIALALAGAPEIVDGFSELGRTLNTPPLSALIMAKNELEARKRAADAAAARERSKLLYAEARYTQLIEELGRYNEVNRMIENAVSEYRDAGFAGSPLQLSAYELISLKAADTQKTRQLNRARRHIKAAISLQTYAESLSRLNHFETEYRIIAVDYETNTAINRARIDQWLAMISPLVAQQKTYHDSGIKTEDLTSLAIEFAKAAGLIAIAAK